MKKLFLLLTVLASVLAALAQPPTITSFSPTVGPVGTTVSITGANFRSTPAENIVYFGAVKAPVISASSTALTVTAPAGATYEPITVTTNGLTGYAAKPFVQTFPNDCVGFYDNSFAPKMEYPTGAATNNYPVNGIAIGDLDGDGKPDLAVANSTSGAITVLRNAGENGSVAFAEKIAFPTNSTHGYSPEARNYVNSVAIADVDGDG